MPRLLFKVILLCAVAGFNTLPAAPPTALIDEKHRGFLKEYCVECHNADKQKGKLRLDAISFTLDTVERADRWQKILNQINAGEMPPDDVKQPTQSAKANFLEMLSDTMVTARQSIGDNRGQLTMRRLNRREYKNTLRELLGVEIPVAELPADNDAGTFDTVGSSLFMSSDQFEQYLALGRQAIDEHFVRFNRPAAEFKLHVETETLTTPKIAKGYAIRVDCHERYVAWTAAVDVAAQRPENAPIVASIKAEKKRKPAYDFYREWARIAGAPSPEKFGYTDAIHAEQQGRRNWVHSAPQQKAYLDDPATKTGSFLTYADVFANPYQSFNIPGNWPAGAYTIRIRVAATANTPKSRHFLEFGPMQGAVASTHEITGTMESPQVLEIPLTLATGGSRGFYLRERGSFDSNERALQIFGEALQRNGIGPEFALWLDWIEVVSTRLTAATSLRERREVELHANAKVGGTYNGYYKGGYAVAKAYLESDRTKPPSAFGKGIPDLQEAKFRVKVFEQHGPSFKRYLDDPLTQTGALLTTYKLHAEEVITLPPDQPSGWLKTPHAVNSIEPGDYVLRFRVGALKNAPAGRRFIELGSRIAQDEFGLLQTFQISGTTEAPQIIEFPVSLTAQGPRTFVLREKRDVKLDHELYEETRKATGFGPPAALWVDWVEWEGPLKHTPTNRRTSLVTAAAGRPEPEHARAILADFATRAFRGQTPSPAYLDKLAQLFAQRRQAGEGFEAALRTPLAAILASPGFLYLAERSEPGKARRLTDLELATRLSYFLWSAPPDDRLLHLAHEKKLADPKILAAEVDRLVTDPRSQEFVVGFVHQWLGLDRLDFFQFDTKQFREFDESTKAAARREVYESYAHLLRTNGSLTHLLKSDEVVINGLLASYYGIAGVTGDNFRAVKVPAGLPRGGLTGMAAILAMGGNGERTSPVERGAWILRKLLHEPPPPAPPNVPQLNRLESKPLTTRERVAAHQEQAQCTQCHRKMDPLGFGLENFDAAGKWRTTETFQKKGQPAKTWPIEPAGAFYKGPAFKDYFQLRDLIADRGDKFGRGHAEALIEYGLGRPFGFLDEDLAATMVRQAATQDFTLRAFLHTLILSPTFQTK